MRGASGHQPKPPKTDLHRREVGTAQRKRSHSDVSPEHVPQNFRGRGQRQPARTNNVRLDGPPKSDYFVRIDFKKARNWLDCLNYQRGDATESDVRSKTISLVRNSNLSLHQAWECILAAESVGLPPDVRVYGALIEHCAEDGDIKEALKVLAEMRFWGIAPDPRIYNALIQACNKACMYHEVRELYAVMQREGIARNAWICKFYQDGPNKAANVKRVTAACLLNNECRASWPEALACLEEMKKVDLTPDEKICRGVVLAYPKELLTREAGQILADLKQVGIPTGIEVLAQLIAICEQEGLKEKAMELLKEGMQLAPPLLKPGLGLDPSSNIISFDRDGVLATPTHETETTLFHLAPTLIRFHESNGAIGARTQFDLARRDQRLKETVAQCMRDRGLAPVTGVRRNGTPNEDRLESGQVVLPRCLEYGHFDSALATFHQITGQGFLPTTAECSRLISACHKRQRTQDSAEVFSALILACARSERLDDALDYLSQAVNADAYPNAAACHALIRACGSAGRPDEAKAVFGKLLTSQIEFKLAICNVMISTCEQRGWIEEARLAFNGMLQFGVSPDASSYIAMIAAYQRGGQPAEKIGRLFAQAVHEGHFDSALGYVLAESEKEEPVRILYLLADAIAPERADDAPVSPYFALALIEHHRGLGRIDWKTEFVVDDAAKDEIAKLTGIAF